MARYKANKYVLESIWEEQTVECEADSIEEAKKKFLDVEYDFDYEIISHQMGELEDSGLKVNVEDIELIESETEEKD
jgi:hypothetical protein